MTAVLPRPLDLSALTELVTDVAAAPALWRPHLRFRKSGRFWTPLLRADDVDVWLLSWLQDQETDLHDHGGSSAAFTVVAGALRELRPGDGEDDTFRREPGETVWVSPGVVHDVANPWPAPAVSLHAYSPPLTHMTYYERHADGLAAVETRASDGPER